ncbi:MAG TPA: hypothetical protein VKB72_11985 [Steroidobacteraceae bacterium]|nr:hypothetical protein [Steroidobacteraceae bacterium]
MSTPLLEGVESTHTYRMALWARALVIGVGLAFLGGAAALLLLVGRRANASAGAALIAGLPLALLGGYLLLGGLRSRVVLTVDAIESYGALLMRRLARSDIKGRRLLRLQYGQTAVELVPREPGARPLKLSRSAMRTDAALETWLDSIPDLDIQEAAAARAEIASNPELGQTPEERLASLGRAKKRANTFNGATWAAAIWGFFYPQPYAVALLVVALLPWAAIILAAKSHGLYRLDARRNDVRPNLATPMYLPGFVLLMRAVQDLGVLNWQLALTYAVLATFIVFLAAVRSDPTLWERRSVAIALFCIMGAYGYGAVALGNSQLDGAAGQNYRVQVLAMHYSRGSRSTTYYLTLAPWGPRTSPEDVSVTRAVYADTRSGGQVCIHQGPGALGIGWYVVKNCG